MQIELEEVVSFYA